MSRVLIGALILSISLGVQAADPGTAQPAAPAPGQVQPSHHGQSDAPESAPLTPAELDKVMYALGQLVGNNLDTLSLTPHELALVQKGLADAANAKPSEVDMKVYTAKVQDLAKERGVEAMAKNKVAGKAYADKAAGEPGATRTATGVIFKMLNDGNGASPAATDHVKVNYEGRLISGKVFDASTPGTPATLQLNQVIACWTAAVQMMKVGGKALVVCPPETAYGDRPTGPIRPGSTLVFTIELVDIVK